MSHQLVRSRRGGVIHHAACYAAAKGGVPWRWADTVPLVHVQRVAKAIGLHPCKVCHPFGGGQ